MTKIRRYSYLLFSVILILVIFSGCSSDKGKITLADISEAPGEDDFYLVDQFETKDVAGNDRIDIGYCSILIPQTFVLSEENKGMYVSNIYPYDSANIYYSVMDANSAGFVSDSLTLADYEATIEDAFSAMGESVDLVIDSFERIDMESVPCYRIRSHYSMEDVDIQQLTVIVLSKEAHIITYTQMSDDDLMMDFETENGNIRLVKEKSQS